MVSLGREGAPRNWESSLGSVGFAGREAVMQLTEEAVVQIPQCGRVAVAEGAAAVVMSSRVRRGGQRSEGPDVSDPGQALIFHLALQHNETLPRGSSDRC